MGGYGSGYGDMGGYGMNRCCKKKYVEGASDPDMDGYYVLAERAEWWRVPSYCSSPCIYVKRSDMNSENGYSMEGGYGDGMEENGLQKYCFQPSQDTQAMCASDGGIHEMALAAQYIVLILINL